MSLADAPDFLSRRQVRQIWSVAFPRMQNRKTGGAPRPQKPSVRFDRAAQLRNVVAEHFAEAAWLEEVALHVDDQERAMLGSERESIGIGREVYGLVHGSTPGLGTAPIGVGDGVAKDQLEPAAPPVGRSLRRTQGTCLSPPWPPLHREPIVRQRSDEPPIADCGACPLDRAAPFHSGFRIRSAPRKDASGHRRGDRITLTKCGGGSTTIRSRHDVCDDQRGIA